MSLNFLLKVDSKMPTKVKKIHNENMNETANKIIIDFFLKKRWKDVKINIAVFMAWP